jgi:hypothetical protein
MIPKPDRLKKKKEKKKEAFTPYYAPFLHIK